MDAKEEIKERLSVEDVIADYIELKRAGRNLKALSPFTQERTPSFMVSPEKQIWHDFSSSKGGDMFTFVMEMEGVDFMGALEILARKAGVDLSQYARGGGNAKLKDRLHEAVELAAKYYQQTLAKNQPALEYIVKRRGYTKTTIQDFRLGYAPRTTDALTKTLLKRKFTAKELEQAGLSVRRRGQHIDMFRGRIMVPLADGTGRPVGFTARLLGDDDSGPKYINTPQTLLYDKSRHVFGLHLAKEAIRESKVAIMVEGNLDVVASHQAGVENVVAAAGTALTIHQLKSLNRLAETVKLAFDSDKAGIAATERAIPLAQEAGVRLEIIDIEGGKDPDELIKQDVTLWQQAIDGSSYVVDWLLKHFAKQFDLKTAHGKTEFTDRLLSVLMKLSDPVEREHYIKEIGKLTDTSPGTVARKLSQLQEAKKPERRKKPRFEPKELAKDHYHYQDSYLALNMYYPETRDSLSGVDRLMIVGDERRAVLEYVKALKQRAFPTDVPEELQPLADYVKILALQAEELYGEWTATNRMVEAIGLARKIAKDNIARRRMELTEQIRDAEKTGDSKTAQILLKEYQSLLKES